MNRALVCGAGGFIGGHLVERLVSEGYWVRGVDLRHHEHAVLPANDFVIGDLRDPSVVASVIDDEIDEVYQLAADMGGAGYLFTGENDADIMHNSVTINLNVVREVLRKGVRQVFFSSSACVYPEYNQLDPENPNCVESSVYPAEPDSDYGWEKLFSERVYLAFQRNRGLDVKIARLHNIFGPKGTWDGGKEKAPAALCRKVAIAEPGEAIEIWGDGKQTRSFLYVDECIEGIRRLMRSDFAGPFNIGSDERISIRGLAEMILDIAGKDNAIESVPGPQGVRGRTSDNTLIHEHLGWRPTRPLREGLEATYAWIAEQVRTSAHTSGA